MKSLLLLLKGMCMGLADVVPGVSGGTMALVLGIYMPFVEAIKSVNFRWVVPLLRYIVSGFKRDKLQDVTEPLRAVHWGFLLPLAAGIVVAFGIGAKVIPTAMDNYPTEMMGLFIGLILASCIVPIRQMPTRGLRELAVGVAVAIGTYAVIGAHTEPAMTWSTASEDTEMSLMDFSKRHPSLRTPEQLFCPPAPGTAGPDNAPLRAAVEAASAQRGDTTGPGSYTRLIGLCTDLRAREGDLAAWVAYRDSVVNDAGESVFERKHPENPFDTLVVPAGTPVEVPQPAYWFIFLCGVIGICAMVLPGISGSFLLLVLGVYHFMLSTALKGFLSEAVRLRFPEEQFGYVVLFCLGCGVGILTFARVLSWLFRKAPAPTLAAMTGLMLGSLRAIWPFKIGEPHIGVQNVFPTDVSVWVGPGLAFVAGAAIVLTFTFLGDKFAPSSTPAEDKPE